METRGGTVIVGGGIVGASIAFGLVRRGEKVTILDEGDVAFRAARGNLGHIWVQGKGAAKTEYADLTRRSVANWRRFAAELSETSKIDLQFSNRGSIMACLSPEDLEKRRIIMHAIEKNATFKTQYEILDHDELKRRFIPQIGPEVVGGVYSYPDSTVNPQRLLRGLLAAFTALGGRYRARTRVLSCRSEASGIRVETLAEALTADKLVLAAGLDNTRLAKAFDLDIAVTPNRGHVMITERLAPFLEFGMNFIRQTTDGGCIWGDSSEDAGYDDTTRLDVIRDNARRLIKILPLLRDVRIVRAWASLRILTPDGAPIYAQSRADSRVFCVCVHSGVTLAPFHAEDLAGAIHHGALDSIDFTPFRSDRFHVQAT